MDIGFVGLEKMGLNMTLSIHEQGQPIIGFDVMKEAKVTTREQGSFAVDSLSELLKALNKREVIFLNIPAGQITNQLVTELVGQLAPEDITVDSGNSNLHDNVANAQPTKEKRIYSIDRDTPGGIKGTRERVCLMVGDAPEAVKVLAPLSEDLAREQGHLYTGKSGAGHYLKMMHSGIEYVMTQATGEGSNLLETAGYDFALEKVADVRNHGSITEARLMGLAKEVFVENLALANLEGKVAANGGIKWMIEETLRSKMPVPMIALSLFT